MALRAGDAAGANVAVGALPKSGLQLLRGVRGRPPGLGYAVRVVRTGALQAVKERLRVPRELWSCHAGTVGRYFVEGHVPAAAVEELLRRTPPWLGIALPGTPAGSPGMGGARQGPLVVYAVTQQGVWREFGRF